MHDKRWQTYSDYFAAFVPHLKHWYISEIAIDYLFYIDFVMLEMDDIFQWTAAIFFLLVIVVTRISLM